MVPALQGLRKRAAAAQHQHAVETAELVLTLLGESSANSPAAGKGFLAKDSPIYERIKTMGLDKGAPPPKLF